MKFEILQGEVLPFAQITKKMGFATKTANTAHLYQLTVELQERTEQYLPDFITLENTNGTGFKGTIFRKFLEMHNFDLLIDKILDAFYQGKSIRVRQFAREVKANLPQVFKWRTIQPKLKKVHELLEAIVLSQPLPQELQDAIKAERRRMIDMYGELISFYMRSAGSKGEDDNLSEANKLELKKKSLMRLMQADPSISKPQLSKMGAGQHESFKDIQFRDEHNAFVSTDESCILAYHHVYASTYSFQAVSDFKGMRDKDTGEWFHSGIDMDVIMMPITDSTQGGSALGFSDVIDGVSEITFGEKVWGDELVGGAKEFPVTNTRILPNGEVMVNTISGYLQPYLKGILKAIAVATAYVEEIEAPEYEAVELIGKLKKLCVDSEWALGTLYPGAPKMLLSMVQYRTFIPAQHARSTDHQVVYELVQEKYKLLDEKKVLATGTSVGEMCVVGKILRIKNKKHLMQADVKGKILIVDQAYTELLGTIKQGALGWIVIPKALKAHATLNGDGEITQLQGVDKRKLKSLKDGTVVTILFNMLFVGDFGECFKKEDIDLAGILLAELINLGLVEGNTSASRRRKLFPFLRLGILNDNNLLRFEAAGWSAGVPGLFNWVYYDLIDEATDEGKAAKEYIRLAMMTYETDDAVEAYIQRMAGIMFPLSAFSEYFDKDCHIRMYGARLEEDPVYVKHEFPHEPNPIIGFNGAAMYSTEWGRIAATISLRTLKEMEKYGSDSSSIFIPNIISMQDVVPYVEEAIELGLDVAKRGIKLMIENSVSMSGQFIDAPYMEKKPGGIEFEVLAPSLNEYRSELTARGIETSISMSFGFNDFTNSWKGRDGRHCDIAGCTLSDNYTYHTVGYFTMKAVKNGYKVTSCGMPEEGVMLAMMECGASEIGVPGGLKAVNAAKVLHHFEGQLKGSGKTQAYHQVEKYYRERHAA